MGIGNNSFLFHHFVDSIWHIQPNVLDTMNKVVHEKLINGTIVLPENYSEEVEKYNRLQGVSYLKKDNGSLVAVQSIDGVLTPKASYLDAMCGMQSTLDLHETYKQLVADDKVERIVLKIDSPGGVGVGIKEFGNTIFNSRGVKETVAYVDVQAASAGYWLASSCEKIVAQPSAIIGSIGTYIMVPKYKQDKLDYTMNIFQAGSKKLYGSPEVELSEKESEHFNRIVEESNKSFLEDVSRNRGVSFNEVKNLEAGYFHAENAPKWLYSDIGDLEYAVLG